MAGLEAAGLATGLLSVWWLIRQNVLTWPMGIVYTLISLVIFWKVRLYADLGLHLIYLALGVYGWYHWVYGNRRRGAEPLPVSDSRTVVLLTVILFSLLLSGITGWLLSRYTDADVPYLDSATTCFSLGGMWLTARKKIESWYFWFFVDVLAGAIYIYKGIYFYAALYLIYTVMALMGYLSWRRSIHPQPNL